MEGDRSKAITYDRTRAQPTQGECHDRQQADFQGPDHHPAADPRGARTAAWGLLTNVQRGTTTDDPFYTFEEWRSDADTRGYADL